MANYTGIGLFPNIIYDLQNFLEEKSDPRTKDWFLLSGLSPILIILIAYNYFCTKIGPRYMKDRKPYDLKRTLMVYNVLNVVASAWIVYEGLQGGWLGDYSFRCQPVDYSDNPQALRMARAVWVYFIFKIIELLDTVFFVLRKKSNQVTWLHLYHHTMMPICGWIGARYLPGGHGTLLGVINSFIHVIMYSYYLMAAMGPQYQKYLWWKKYLTTMQLIQFVIVFLHQCQLFVYECDYPKTIVMLLTVNAAYFFYLFGVFYIRTYLRGSSKKLPPIDRKQEVAKLNGIAAKLD